MRNKPPQKIPVIRITILLLSGIGMIGISVWTLGSMVWASTLESTEGKVLQVDIRHVVGGTTNLHTPEIEYEYSVAGKTYHGDVYSLISFDNDGTEQWANEVVDRYPVGEACVVYYRKSKPNQCALTRSPHMRSVALSVGLIFLGLIAVCSTLITLSTLRRRKSAEM